VNSPLGAVLETHKSVVIDDTRMHPEWTYLAGASDVIRWLGVPLVVGERVIGVCELWRGRSEPFTREHVQVAEALVGLAAVAIQNAWLFGQVRTGQERLQALARRLVDVQEAERRYIARELHDEAAQVLISMRVGLRLLERQVEPAAPVQSTMNELRRALDSVLEDLNRLTTHLRPASLDHLGLDSALRQYVEGISHQHQITAAYEALGLCERLASDVETALYRIVQEAVSNVVRHAHATRLDVLLEQRDDKLIVLVEDNGIGFDASGIGDGLHLGLVGMRERAEMLGGTLTLESGPGAGTTVLVEVPHGGSDTYRR
jgi:signal transduction histidine kinase